MKKTDNQNIPSIIHDWYIANARDLPWRNSSDPYAIWVSEMMLQQTRVETVITYFHRFMKRLPTIFDLATIDDEELYKLWQGLGYYGRAKNLKKAARMVVEQYEGVLPNTAVELMNLPGIGPYTAGAIASIAYNKQIPAVDGNVMRVISRIYGSKLDITTQKAKKEMTKRIEALLPVSNISIFNQALMELGATICVPLGKPKCECCPVSAYCIAYHNNETASIPVKSKKKERFIQPIAVLLVKLNHGWLLHKRPREGLLADLWEFPNLTGTPSTQEILHHLTTHHIQGYHIELVAKAKHIFSHMEWHMNIYLVEGELTGELEETDTIATQIQIEDQYALPTAFSHCIRIISSHS
ncbi:MAG: A/G-specific adenine glycosylase [Bacilli bacterium]|jgi:A/G-specific adenine glycosylase